jgi:hypothetical protein
MAYSRYGNRQIFINNNEEYRKVFFKDRDVNQLPQFTTAVMGYPVPSQQRGLSISTEIWKSNSRLYKLANDYYGSPQYWWVIAWYNRLPLESDFIVGQKVKIPGPLELVLSYFEKD